ncbi:MAG: erythromycin esterase family protein, partial [Noviherbaspirillum sp.]
MNDLPIIEAIQYEAIPLRSSTSIGYLLEQIGDASIVLLGESTHGSREFYSLRAEITKRLIVEKHFDAIAVEADWPDALRVSRYIRDTGDDDSADQALQGFQRFPQWMWRNTEMVALIDWLRSHNRHIMPMENRVGFFGLDVYSLRKSMDAVVRFLDEVDPEAAREARIRYGCFDRFSDDPQRYGYDATMGVAKGCEEQVVQQMLALTSEDGKYLARGAPGPDELFYAQQNARVAKSAEAYYRTMFRNRDESWNLRDTHMADSLDALLEHIGQYKRSRARIVVWAHNSHIGDASATEMGDRGQLNLGQLVRQRHPRSDTYLIGFTTHTGTVTAASDWDGPAERKNVLPSRPDSVEYLLHQTGIGTFVLPIRKPEGLLRAMARRRLERA